MVATITSSQMVSAVVQINGAISIDESHTDSLGAIWGISKFVPGSTDLNAQLAADANALLASLKDNEIQTNVSAVETLGSLAAPTFNYSTLGQNQPVLREAYRVSTQTQAVMIGDYLNTLTDTQLGNAFNMTPAQVTNLRNNKLIPASNTAASIRNTTGA